MSAEQFDHVVGGLYDAAAGLIPWHQVMDDAATFVGADRIEIRRFDRERRAVEVSLRGGVYWRESPEEQQAHGHVELAESSSEFAPWMPVLYGRNAFSRVVHQSLQHLLSISVQRGVETQAFTEQECDWIDRIGQHAGHAIDLHREIWRSSMERRALRTLLDRSHNAVLLVDAERKILYRNQLADRVLGSGESLVELDGRLACRYVDSNPELGRTIASVITAALEAQGQEGDDSTRSLSAFVRVRGKVGNALCGCFVVAPPSLGPAQGMAMVIVHDRRMKFLFDESVVAKSLGISPSEAKVAVLLTLGMTVEAIAARCAVSTTTVRTQVKSMFEKTGVRRQVDLVRMVVDLPAVGDDLSGVL